MCLHIAFGKLFVGLSSGFVAVIDLKVFWHSYLAFLFVFNYYN